MWCSGEVVQVANGTSDKELKRHKKLLPAGAVRVRWPADEQFNEPETFVWSVLHPDNFNKDAHLGWR